jgi:hypothetical protein
LHVSDLADDNLAEVELGSSPPNHRKPWTRSDDEQLRELMRANTPASLIGQKLGRTPEAVQERMRMIGSRSKSSNPGALPNLWRSVYHGRRDDDDSAPGQQESDSDDGAE